MSITSTVQPSQARLYVRPIADTPAGTALTRTAIEPEVRSAQIADLQTRARFAPAAPANVPATTITVQANDTLETLAERYGTTIDQLARLNPDLQNLDDLQAGQQLNVPANPQVVTVQAGDTLTVLAEHYGVTVDQLAAANGITDPNAIQAGQRISIVPATATGLDSEVQIKAYIEAMQELQGE